MSDRLTGILGHQALELSFRLLVLEVRGPGAEKNARELGPGIGGAHIDNPNRLNARRWRFNPKQGWRLATLHAAPELPLGGNNQVLVKRVGMSFDLDPLAAARDNGEHGCPRSEHPHIVLQLRHVFLGRRLLRKRPRQHELASNTVSVASYAAVQRGAHPTQMGCRTSRLHVRDDLAGIGLVPAPIELLRHYAELNEEIV